MSINHLQVNSMQNQLQIQTLRYNWGGGGPGRPDPEIRGGEGFKKIFFPALRALAYVQTSPLPQEKSGEETSVNRRR